MKEKLEDCVNRIKGGGVWCKDINEDNVCPYLARNVVLLGENTVERYGCAYYVKNLRCYKK